MSTPYEIPLSAEAQTFAISLAGTVYQLTFKWCAPSLTWVLDIADNLGNPIVSGIPLVVGVDLLYQYKYLGIQGALVVQSFGDMYATPGYADLGVNSFLFFVTTP